MRWIKKCGAIICKILLYLLKLINKYNPYKIALALITFILYSFIFSWKFSLLAMLAIGWHENGHIWAMRRVGLQTKGFYFLPFMGGVAISQGQYKSIDEKIFVSIMGPFCGMLLAFTTCIVAHITNNSFLMAAAYWQAMINAFNLLPIGPLDGGQIFRSILSSINKKLAIIFGCVSLILLALLFVKLGGIFFVLITVFSAFELYTFVTNKQELSNLSLKDLFGSLISYILLLLTLVAIMIYSYQNGASDWINILLKG